jgi:hypothetical protein
MLALLPSAVLLTVQADGVGDGSEEAVTALRRDLPLLQDLVKAGLSLAAEDDPLKRAALSNHLVERLALELRETADKHETVRLSELGEHFQSLLMRGVAGNLQRARAVLPPDSPRLQELARVGADAVRLTRPLAQSLEQQRRGPNEDPRRVLQQLEQGCLDIENAVAGKAPTARPAPDKTR